MDLYFLSLNNLDRPLHNIDKLTLFQCTPFFNDYYVVVYLKSVHVPKPDYKPIIVNDRDLVKNYGALNLPDRISQVIAIGEQVHSRNYKIAYRILVLKNGWWCVYIEKRYTWDSFQSLGVTTIMSPSKTAVLDFFQEHFVPHLTKKKRERRINRTIKLPSELKYEQPPILLSSDSDSDQDYGDAVTHIDLGDLDKDYGDTVTSIADLELDAHFI